MSRKTFCRVMKSSYFLKFILVFTGLTLQSQNHTVVTRDINALNQIENSGREYVCSIKSGKSVELIEFSSNYWKVKYKKCIGFIESTFLETTPYMQTFYDEYSESMKLEAKRVQDSIDRAEKNKELAYQRKLDSIANRQKELRLQKQMAEFQARKTKDSLRRVNDSLKFVERRSKCHFKTNEIDEFTGAKRVLTEYYSIQKLKYGLDIVSIQLGKYGNKYVRFYLRSDLGCASPYDPSYVAVKLENNDILTFYHKGDVECEGVFILLAYLSNSDINRLKKSPIKTIRFSGTEGYQDERSFYYPELFIEKLSCIK
ncbi:SH3 domain-containing protein [Winogradskyella aurantiaca]|uniref:hypothetical protein n=1 Tax=Winogradskyella aurantiaca TaxID=2219558 RepID=UPI0013007A9A|nr:hypothetical protein [Winogradskyella aurantiaca]